MYLLNRRRLLLDATTAGLSGVYASSLALKARAEKIKFRLKLGNDLPPTHPVNIRVREAIIAIRADTNSEVSIELFPNSQLGSDSDMMSQLRSGALELATFPGTVMSTLIPAMSIAGLGFAFENYEKIWAAMDGDLGDYMRVQIVKAHLQPFTTVWDNGLRQITTSIKPIRTPDDLRNFKMRVPIVPLWVSMFSALGASPVSIPLSEAYSSLQTQIADGQEILSRLSKVTNSTKFKNSVP